MKIEFTPKFQKSLKKCRKRNWRLEDLSKILESYTSKGGFSKDETIRYKDHELRGKWKDHREFHPYGRHHDWVVIYHVEDDTVVLDDTTDERTMVLDDTGSHKEMFGSSQAEIY